MKPALLFIALLSAGRLRSAALILISAIFARSPGASRPVPMVASPDESRASPPAVARGETIAIAWTNYFPAT